MQTLKKAPQMPSLGKWYLWPVVLIRDDILAHLASPDLQAATIAALAPRLRKGVCFGVCAHWFRRHFDHPSEPAVKRVSRLAKRLGAMDSAQFGHMEIGREARREENRPPISKSEQYTAAARVSRLRFAHCLEVQDPQTDGGIAKLIATLQAGHLYLLAMRFDRFAVPLDVTDPGPSRFSHAIAIAYDDVGPSKVFDMCFGEFEVDQLGLFLAYHYLYYKGCGWAIIDCDLYEVSRTPEFPDAHRSLGRNWDVERTDIV